MRSWHAVALLITLTTAALAGCSPPQASGQPVEAAATRGASGTAGTSPPGRPGQPAAAQAPFSLAGRAITSPDGIRYTLYSGTTPSFDGLPLAVDVTIPAGTRGPLPLVVMFHGWGQSRTAWESATVANTNPNVSGWNNVAFAARGYAVLNYTARGWHDSCGPDTATVPDNPATLPAACSSRAYWVHLADPRWEIRDAQYLIGTLVDVGVAAPDRIGVTGGSYGGGHSLLLALLNDRMMLQDGTLVPWRSPRGVPLRIAAAVPEYTWASLTNSLIPNGRASDADAGSRELFEQPVGVPIQSYVTGLYADGPALRNGFYAPPGADPTADLTAWYARVTAGNPYDPAHDPVLAAALAQLDLRSPLYLTPDAGVPIFQVQGLTDPLFPPVQALLLRNKLLAWNPAYPIADFFADVGHSNANNPADEWAAANAVARAFFDHYLLGRGARPAADVTLMTTQCVAGQTRVTYHAAGWIQLARGALRLSSTTPQATGSAAAGPEGPNTDPIVHSGCLSSPVPAGTGVAAWTFAVPQPYTLVGQPAITVSLLGAGADEELNARLWDVAPDGGSQTLVSRGTYRLQGTAGAAAQVTFQTTANGWQFQAGHTLRVEIVGNDSPYYQADSVPSAATITAVSLRLPVA